MRSLFCGGERTGIFGRWAQAAMVFAIGTGFGFANGNVGKTLDRIYRMQTTIFQHTGGVEINVGFLDWIPIGGYHE